MYTPYFSTEPYMLIVQENAWDLWRIFPVTRVMVQTPRELWFQGKQSQGESPATTRKKEIRRGLLSGLPSLVPEHPLRGALHTHKSRRPSSGRGFVGREEHSCSFAQYNYSGQGLP
jgi:hypothetical protein